MVSVACSKNIPRLLKEDTDGRCDLPKIAMELTLVGNYRNKIEI